MTDEPVRILVVDDEPGMREGCRRILTAEGYEVETAADGLAGLELFEARRNFAAGIFDLKMPRMDGIELIERIHRQDKGIVLLVITAYAAIETAVEATKRGAYGYIPKPFTPNELLLPVKQGLERRALTIEAQRLREEREKRLLEVTFERSKSRTIINCMTDSVLVINREKQIVLRNAAARVILEREPGQAVVPLSALDCDPLASLVSEALGAVSGPLIMSKEMAFGENMYMANASHVFDPGGEVLGAVVVLRDITARKKLEDAKSLFVSLVAHEIKSPLAAIEGYLNVILQGMTGEVSDKTRKMMERSRVRISALRTMVSDLMNLVTIQAGRLEIRRAPLDIRKTLADVIEMSKDKALEKNIDIATDCAEPLDPVLADGLAMRTVFMNIVDNAVKYTPDNGHVRIKAKQVGDHVSVTVQDDGIGMAQEEKKRVFEEFFRVKNEFTAAVPGTGLGLSLVKRLVDMHHGRITVETALGEGSTFTVSLPTAEEEGGRTP